MKKSCLATLSGPALGGAIIINAPYAWSQAGQPGSDAAPPPGQGKGSESQVQKPTDPPIDSGPRSGSPESGMTRGESTGMQKGTESRTTGGHRWSKDKVKEVQEASPFPIDRNEYGNMDDWLLVEKIENVKA